MDLDGLRGFAIALVVIFHVFVGRVSGGVDVFLLLSGYFFLGGQLRYALRPNPNLNPWWPLWRTIRRLLPALAVVLSATLIGVLALTPERMNSELARQFTASILYFQNWELTSQELDYAAAGQDTSPLQHLWSMSVQGQFYFFAILMGWVVAVAVRKGGVEPAKARRGAIAVLAVITVASFVYASRFGLVGTPANYYSTFSRAWELSLGALLAFVPDRFFLPRSTAGLAAGVGVAMIAATGFLIPTSLAFPGPLTLIPLVGAAMVVLSGNANPVSSILASKPMTWLGQVAYSLYLWHWPLLIIVSGVAGYDTPPPAAGLAVIAVSLALAHITHTLVEDPLRQHRPRPLATDHPVADARESVHTWSGAFRMLGGVLTAALMAIVLAIQPLWEHRVNVADRPLDPAIYPGARSLTGAQAPAVPPRPDPALIAGMFPPIGEEGCMIFIPGAPDAMPGPDCVYGDVAATTTVALVGGSHIEPYVIPLDALGREHHFKVVPFVRQACPIVSGGPDDPANDFVSPECAEWGEHVVAQLEAMQPDLVISNSTRPAGVAGEGAASQDFVPDTYVNLWQRFSDAGIPFLGLRDNPWIFDVLGNPMDPNICIVAGHSQRSCSMERDVAYGPEDPSAPYFEGWEGRWHVDTSGWFCPDDTCPPQIGNVYVYRDQNHISNAYAASLQPLLWNELRPVFDALGIAHV